MRPSGKARRGKIPAVCDRGATQPGGMQRRSNAAGLSPRAARRPRSPKPRSARGVGASIETDRSVAGAGSLIDRRIGQRMGHDRPRWVDAEMELLPAALAVSAVFRSGPFTFAYNRQSRTVNDELDGSVGRDTSEDEPARQRGLDRQIRKPLLPAWPTGRGRFPRVRGVGREPQRHVASLDERSFVLRPVPTRYFVLYCGCTLDFIVRSCADNRQQDQRAHNRLPNETNGRAPTPHDGLRWVFCRDL